MTRRTPLKRSTTPLKRSPLPRSTKPIPKRRKGKPRRGPAEIPPEQWRNPKYLKFLRQEGRCVACSSKDHRLRDKICHQLGRGFSYQCDPAHGKPNGRGQKGPDAEAIPLCRAHHDEQGKAKWEAFESKYGFSREKEAAVWWTAFTICRENEK